MQMRRLPFLALGILLLVLALWTGLIRLGWSLPIFRDDFSALHGPLMIAGFFGTVISLERAVGSGFRWAYAAPALSILGSIGLILDAPILLAQSFLIASSVVLVAASRVTWVGVGAAFLLAANILWTLEMDLFRVVYYWMAFLVVTIAAERLEMSRALGHSRGVRSLFLAALAILIGGVIFEIRVAGVGLIALGLWLFRYDLARRTIRQRGLTRFIAACLLSGYAWLIAGGLSALVFGGLVDVLRYDVILHSVFLGFVMTMIFAHAPVIFPAILGVTMAYGPRYYIPLVLLHASLILRVAGDLAGWLPGREWGGLLNVFSIVLFLLNTAGSIRFPVPVPLDSVPKSDFSGRPLRP